MKYNALLLKVFSAEILAKIFIGLIGVFLIRFMSIDEFATYTLSFTIFILSSSIVSSVFNIIFIYKPDIQKIDDHTHLIIIQCSLLCIIGILLSSVNQYYDLPLISILLLATIHTIFMFRQTVLQKSLNFGKYYYLEFTRVTSFLIIFIICVNSFADISSELILNVQTLATIISLCTRRFFKDVQIGKIKGIDLLSEIQSNFDNKNITLFLYFIFVAILLSLDMLFLRLLSDDIQLAQYGAAYRYYGILQVGLIASQKIIVPHIGRTNDAEQVALIYSQHRKMSNVILFCLPVGIYAIIQVMPLIDNNKYPESPGIFAILAASAYISFRLSPYSNLLMKEKLYGYLLRVITIGLVLHVTMLHFLIEQYLAYGAAVASLVSYAFVNVLIYVKGSRLLKNDN